MVVRHTALGRQKRAEDSSPISFKETLEMVNQFVVQTTQFLNNFAVICGDKLNQVDRDLQRIEITLNLLEAKLNSIEGLGTTPPAAPAAPAPGTAAPPLAPAPGVGAPPPPPPPPGVPGAPPLPPSGAPLPPPPAPIPEPPAENVLLCKDDPRLQPFYKFIRIGAPPEQVEQKMRAAGFDPALLNTPDAPSPLGPLPPPGDDSEDSGSESD